MGKIGGIDIGDPYCSGGAFELVEAPTNDDYIGEWEEISPIKFPDGWDVFLSSETAYIVAQTERDIPRGGVFESSLGAVTRALDVFSIISDFHGQTSDSRDDHILWWEGDNEENILKLVGTAPLETRVRARVTVNGEKSTPTIPDWNESFRYFRLSILTDDIFDTYRNQFLAVEYFLSNICPRETGENIGDWMERALSEAHDKYDISDYAPSEDNPVASIHGYQYRHIRCGMFHSQATPDPNTADNRLTPRRQSDIETVKNALNDLTGMYAKMVGEEFDNSPNTRSGGMTFAGFEMAMESLLNDEANEIILTPEDVDTDPEFQLPESAEILDTTISNEHEGQGVKYVEATTDIKDMGINKIQKSILINRSDEGLKSYITGEYSNHIYISGFDVLEVIKGSRLSSD